MALDNLPAHLSSFVGRVSEQEELLRLLGRARLVTLTGAGGCGKTRLAARVAARAAERFPDGVCWVELAPVGSAMLVAPTLAHVVGVRPLPGETNLDAVLSHLAPRRLLVVLDNCEHLLDEVARAVESVGRGCPDIRVVATSREPLRAEGEVEWRVPSLSLPPAEWETASGSADAVRLFVERAGDVRPGFALTEQNASAVVEICRSLDGIPLALELAAARLRAFSVEQVADGLSDRFRFLASGARTALPRQQTLRASVEWSHDLLSEPERAVFRRLGVFVGGFTMEAAEHVCSARTVARESVLGIAAALVEKSLVQAEERDAVVRYRLLETIRHYALDRLEEANEAEATRRRHCAYFLDVAESLEPGLLTPSQPDIMRGLDPEAANLEHAIAWASVNEPETALRLCVAITLWWRLRSRFAQAEAGFSRALRATAEPSSLRARAMWGRAFLLTFAGELQAASPAAQDALDVAEQVGDDATAARSLWLIGIATMWADPLGSRPALERSRHLAAGIGDDFALMHATQGLGMSYLLQDEHRRARSLHEEALPMAERMGQQDALAWHWVALALSAWVAGDHATLRDAVDRARDASRLVGDVVTESAALCALGLAEVDAGRPGHALEELERIRERALARGGALMVGALDLTTATAHAADGSLEEARSELERLLATGGAMAWALIRAHVLLAEVHRLLGGTGARAVADQGYTLAGRIDDLPLAAEACVVLGRLAAARSEWAEAQRLHHEALPIALDSGSPRLPRVLEALAEVAGGLGEPVEAVRLLGAAEGLWKHLDLVPWAHQRRETAALQGRLRDALDAEAFERAYAEGQSLTADEAVAYARRARGPRRRPAVGWDSLTPTEVEVARHVASGLTNPEIAERMFISRGTVRTHLSHIFAKVGVKSRAGLAAEVARRGADER